MAFRRAFSWLVLVSIPVLFHSASRAQGGESAEVAIGLPRGGAPGVSVSLGEGSVTLDLPAEATFPVDFSQASGGLLRSGEATKLGDQRVRLELRLAGGLLSTISWTPSSMTLRFHRGVAPAAGPASAAGQYVLGADDKLRIAVNGSEEMTQESVVGRNGTVPAPMVGEVTAAGLSVDAFAARLTELLARDYLVSPKVDVQVVEYRSQWVLVTGEVKKAGRVFLRGSSTLKEVLSEAEGYTSDAGEMVTISRVVANPGDPTTVSIDRGAFERGETNPEVHPGDIVTVEPAAVCFVNGEVKNPGNVKVTRGMTLLRAISVAGGFTEWANRKEVYVSHHGSDAPPTAYNLKKIESNPELDPVLKGGELILVKRRFL